MFNVGVRSRERPTVDVALTVSKIISRKEALFVVDKSREDTRIIENDENITAIALFIDCLEKLLLNKETEALFLIIETAVKKSTATVTVLTPPAVPIGEPPMNMSKRETIEAPFVSSF